MKETYYFSHDYNTRSDEKIKKLIRQLGMEGYGIYWAIIEDLYQNANALQTDCEGIAYDMRVDKKVVESVIYDYELFVIQDNIFRSNSVQSRLDERKRKSASARKSALKRWDKNRKDANAMPTQSVCNAIKERKGKEKKGKEKKVNNIETRKSQFYKLLTPYSFDDRYSKEIIDNFYDYWTEHGINDRKMRFEKQTSFDIGKRLIRWRKSEHKKPNTKKSAMDILKTKHNL